jgi:hypothetical protein
MCAAVTFWLYVSTMIEISGWIGVNGTSLKNVIDYCFQQLD